jgi:hypothetical protein
MAEISLITITDVQGYRRVDPKFDVTRFNTFVMEAQRTNLRGLFGDALYYAFMSDTRISGIYKELLDGKTYTYNNETIMFYGLKPALCYWWLAIAAREGDLFLSGYGAIQYTNNPQQNFESSKEKERIAVGYIQTAQGYADDIVKFLDENASIYSLWKNNEEVNSINFVSFRL